MALQPRIIACGNSVAAFAMSVRFLIGPAVMAAASFAVGLRGVLLHIAIVQVKPWNQMINIFPKCDHGQVFCLNILWHCVWIFRQLFHKGLCPLSLQRNIMFILTYWALGKFCYNSNIIVWTAFVFFFLNIGKKFICLFIIHFRGIARDTSGSL